MKKVDGLEEKKIKKKEKKYGTKANHDPNLEVSLWRGKGKGVNVIRK